MQLIESVEKKIEHEMDNSVTSGLSSTISISLVGSSPFSRTYQDTAELLAVPELSGTCRGAQELV